MTGHTTPKGMPQTPPASTRKSHGTKPIPKFQLPDVTPESHHKAGHVQLQTPATTHKKHGCLTPHDSLNSAHGATLFPPSPDFTPKRSPRTKRKKISFERILPLSDTFHALLPNHGFVGSGRRHADVTPAHPKPPVALGPAEIFELNRNLDFEQDILASPSKQGRPRKHVPKTPGKQLITEEKIHSWHGNSFRGSFSSDEDESDGENSCTVKLSNPFLDTKSTADSITKLSRGSGKINPFASNDSVVDYATHMELINHRTGERRIELLLEEQQKFKPKKLNFTGI